MAGEASGGEVRADGPRGGPGHAAPPGGAPGAVRTAGPTARERARAQVMAELLAAARARLETDGPAGLSLRAVARDLGVASSAVYRYVPSRDALLTELIIESYDRAGAVCEDAAAAARDRGESPAQAWLAVGRAFRAWATEDPHSYELLYGTPVPGYLAPKDTVPHALRLWAVIVGIVLDAHAAGSLRPTGPEVDGDGLLEPAVLEFGAGVAAADPSRPALGPDGWGPADAARSMTLFTSLIGAVTAELFGHLHGVATDLGRLFDVTLATAAAGVGLHVDLNVDARSAQGER